MTDNQIAAEDAQHDRLALVGDFVKSSADYYRARFHEIGSQSSYIFSFNLWAFLLGPIWFSARSIWNWGLAFLILETFGWVQIIRGAFGDLAAGARERIEQIEGTLVFRQKQLQAALDKGSEKAEVYRRTVESLEANIGEIRMEAVRAEEAGLWIMLSGLAALLLVKFVQAAMANMILEKRFSNWLSNRSLVRHDASLLWPRGGLQSSDHHRNSGALQFSKFFRFVHRLPNPPRDPNGRHWWR